MSLFRTVFIFIATALVLWICGYALFLNSVIRLEVEKPDEVTDAIVVLTGGNHRVNTGFELFSLELAPKLFITGVNNDVSLDELVSSWPGLPDGRRSLPACCMELGYSASSTLENAEEARDWIRQEGVKSIRLVTSPYHMPRALLEFRSLMPDLQIVAHPVTKDSLSMTDRFFWDITFLEYHKTLYRSSRLSMPR